MALVCSLYQVFRILNVPASVLRIRESKLFLEGGYAKETKLCTESVVREKLRNTESVLISRLA